jgi:hypothetical protein
MSLSTKRDPDEQLQRDGDELEERIDRLGSHIDDAKRSASAHPDITDTAGDWEDTDDEAGGDDPEGFDDPEADDENEDDDFRDER